MSAISLPRTRTRSRQSALGGCGVELRGELHSRSWFVGVVGTSTVALGGLVVCWFGVSGSVRLSTQAGWLAVGLGSLIVAGLGFVGWLAHGLRQVALLRRHVVGRPSEGPVHRDPVPVPAPTSQWGTCSGMRRFHRAECSLLVGKQVQWLDRPLAGASELLPCGICEPQRTGRPS